MGSRLFTLVKSTDENEEDVGEKVEVLVTAEKVDDVGLSVVPFDLLPLLKKANFSSTGLLGFPICNPADG